VAVLRAVVNYQHDPRCRHAINETIEQALGLAVDPVKVLDDQQETLLLRLAQ
jgi:hypothetical protein